MDLLKKLVSGIQAEFKPQFWGGLGPDLRMGRLCFLHAFWVVGRKFVEQSVLRGVKAAAAVVVVVVLRHLELLLLLDLVTEGNTCGLLSAAYTTFDSNKLKDDGALFEICSWGFLLVTILSAIFPS